MHIKAGAGTRSKNAQAQNRPYEHKWVIFGGVFPTYFGCTALPWPRMGRGWGVGHRCMHESGHWEPGWPDRSKNGHAQAQNRPYEHKWGIFGGSLPCTFWPYGPPGPYIYAYMHGPANEFTHECMFKIFHSKSIARDHELMNSVYIHIYIAFRTFRSYLYTYMDTCI